MANNGISIILYFGLLAALLIGGVLLYIALKPKPCTAAEDCNGRGDPSGNRPNCTCSNCTEGYTGNNCEISPVDPTQCTAAEDCNGRGDPSGNRPNCTCSNCRDGYTGDNCDIAPVAQAAQVAQVDPTPCTAAEDCNGHGTASGNRPDCTCSNCTDGYSGDKCEIPPVACTADEDCNGHGTASGNRPDCICSNCTDGYTGDKCEIDPVSCTKDEDCNGRGTASGNRPECTCDCFEGYSGDRCLEVVPIPCTKEHCNWRVRGDPSGYFPDCKCDCLEGYTGQYCDRSLPICTDVDCNWRGDPSGRQPNCICSNCRDGYSGDNCEIDPVACTADEDCNGRGDPSGYRPECTCSNCTDGYSGDNCEIDPCTQSNTAKLSNTCTCGTDTDCNKGNYCYNFRDHGVHCHDTSIPQGAIVEINFAGVEDKEPFEGQKKLNPETNVEEKYYKDKGEYVFIPHENMSKFLGGKSCNKKIGATKPGTTPKEVESCYMIRHRYDPDKKSFESCIFGKDDVNETIRCFPVKTEDGRWDGSKQTCRKNTERTSNDFKPGDIIKVVDNPSSMPDVPKCI